MTFCQCDNSASIVVNRTKILSIIFKVTLVLRVFTTRLNSTISWLSGPAPGHAALWSWRCYRQELVRWQTKLWFFICWNFKFITRVTRIRHFWVKKVNLLLLIKFWNRCLCMVFCDQVPAMTSRITELAARWHFCL